MKSNIMQFNQTNTRLVWVVFIVVFASCLGYWFFNRNYISTNDAYINADVIQISPQVTGKVIKVFVQNNQFVKAGEPLFDIDPIPYQMIVDRDQTQLDLVRLSVGQQMAGLKAAEADVVMRQAELENAKLTAQRIRKLYLKHYESLQADDDAQSKLKAAGAALSMAEANLEQARKKLGTPGEDNEQIRQAKTNLAQAKLNLAYTHVTAPEQGNVTNMSLHMGDVVQANQPLFALISDKEFWADANFKETELEYIRPGQKAKISVDMYPDKVFYGVVNSVSRGSGAAFSLLPPENATGNWVKVTQRVPVKVMIINVNAKTPLHVGTTATVTIHISRKNMS